MMQQMLLKEICENKAEAETTSNPFENMGADNPFTQGFADANK